MTTHDLLITTSADITSTPLVAYDNTSPDADDLDRDARNLDTTARWLREHSVTDARDRAKVRGLRVGKTSQPKLLISGQETNAALEILTNGPASRSQENSDSETLPPPSYHSQQPTSTYTSSGGDSDGDSGDSTDDTTSETDSGQSRENAESSNQSTESSSYTGEDTTDHTTPTENGTTPTLKELTNTSKTDSSEN